MGFSFGLTLLIILRAGRLLHQLTPENFEEKVTDLVFDSIKSEICNQLERLFNLFVPNFTLPDGFTIQDVANSLHNDVEDLDLLQDLLFNLVYHGVDSPFFTQAVDFRIHF